MPPPTGCKADGDQVTELSQRDIERIAAAVSNRIGHKSAEHIAAAAARTAVQELTVKGLAFVGVDVADKKQIEQLKADLSFIRAMRHFSERTSRQVTSAITNAITWGIIGLLVIGFIWWSRGAAISHTPAPPGITK
jgi:hypothetical protein